MKQIFTTILFILFVCVFKPNYLAAQVNVNDSLALVALYNNTDGPHWIDHTNWLTSAPVGSWSGITEKNYRVIGINRVGNNLKGMLPIELGNLVQLKYLFLENNKLSGSIPSSVGKLTKLYDLVLGTNELSGHIPSELGNLTQLSDLVLQYNRLSGNIPSSIGKLSGLYSLILDHNKLSGGIPAALGNLTALNELLLNHNNLSNTIPYSLTKLVNLSTLTLDSNKFTFAGMGRIASSFPSAHYSPQANIPLHKNGNTFSVSAGGKLFRNTYKWYKGTTLVATIKGDSTYQPTKNGAYHVAVTNSIATALTLYSDTVNYVVSDNSIASKMNNNSSISVYPNPAKAFTTLSFITDGKYTITIADVSGKILQTKTGIAGKGSNTIQFDVSKYASGIYLITINDEKNKKQTLRLSKE